MKSNLQLQRPFRGSLRAVLAAGSLALLAAGAAAQAPLDRGAVEARYQADRQACLSGQTMQDSRSACLYDARLARQAALAGWLGGEDPGVLERNRTMRCDALPGDSEDDCLRVMNGEGEVSGSVEAGAVVRELVTEEPVPDAVADIPQAGAQP